MRSRDIAYQRRKLADLKAAHKKVLDERNAQFAKEMEVMKRRIIRQKTKEMETMRKQVENKMQRSLQDAELKLQTTMNEHEKVLHKLKQTLTRQVQRAREAHERQVNEMENAMRQKTAALQLQKQKAINEAARQNMIALDEAKTAARNDMQRAAANHQQAVSELKARGQREVRAAEARIKELDTELKRQRDEFETKLATERRDAADHAQQLHAKNQMDASRAAEVAAAQLKAAKVEAAALHEETRSSLQAKIQALEEELARERDRLTRKAADDVRTMRERGDQALKKAREDAAATQRKTEHRLQAEMETMKATHVRTMNETANDSANAFKRMETKLGLELQQDKARAQERENELLAQIADLRRKAESDVNKAVRCVLWSYAVVVPRLTLGFVQLERAGNRWSSTVKAIEAKAADKHSRLSKGMDKALSTAEKDRNAEIVSLNTSHRKNLESMKVAFGRQLESEKAQLASDMERRHRAAMKMAVEAAQTQAADEKDAMEQKARKRLHAAQEEVHKTKREASANLEAMRQHFKQKTDELMAENEASIAEATRYDARALHLVVADLLGAHQQASQGGSSCCNVGTRRSNCQGGKVCKRSHSCRSEGAHHEACQRQGKTQGGSGSFEGGRYHCHFTFGG